MKYQELGQGVVKRKERRVLGLFIDGTGLDRATRRISRKVDLSNLVRGVTSGMTPVVARYYTLIPYEDDSRQRAFLDAVYRAGLEVIIKRLPPKGVTRQVSVDVEMTADLVAFALGHQSFSDLSRYQPGLALDHGENQAGSMPHGPMPFGRARQHACEHPAPKIGASKISIEEPPSLKQSQEPVAQAESIKEQRIVTVVCPSRELSYPLSMVKELGVDTISADFGQFNTGDVLKSAAKWIDLSDSETIWRE